MPTVTLELSDEQIVQLVTQLPPERQNEIYARLVRQQWPRWVNASQGAEDQVRRLAQERNLNWDAMNEEERMIFVNDLVHEGRGA